MPIYKRQECDKLLRATGPKAFRPVYLIVGDRFLCRNTAEALIDRLLPAEARQSHLHGVDGDQEDVSRTLHLLKSYSLFPGPRVIRIIDSRIFLSKGVARAIWDKAEAAMTGGDPRQAGRYLAAMLEMAGIETAEAVDLDLAGMAAARWKNLFGFVKPPEEIAWTGEALAGMADQTGQAAGSRGSRENRGGDAAALYQQTFEKGLPANNILILTAETVDKRKRFFKYIEEHGAILDLAVDTGAGAAARQGQDEVLRELVRQTLAGLGKKIEAKALQMLLERVGFHPVAAVMESEKLALYAGDAPVVTEEDLEVMVGRTREEALYEFLETFTNRRLAEALGIAGRLQENGVHVLAMLAALRNHINKLLLVLAFRELDEPAYSPSLSFDLFQKQYLPALKAGREEWTTLLWKNHPYGLYQLFRQAGSFKAAELRAAIVALLEAEFRCKGSPLPAGLVLDAFLFSQLPPLADRKRQTITITDHR